MDDKAIPEASKVFIDFFADYLRDKYSDGRHIDFEAMIRNFNVIIPDIDCIVPYARKKDPYYYLFRPKKSFPQVRRFIYAHELGHIILRHCGSYLPLVKGGIAIGEAEANYFAKRLGVASPPKILRHLNTLWAFWRNRHNFVNYVRKIDKETLDKVMRDGHALETLLMSEEFYQN